MAPRQPDATVMLRVAALAVGVLAAAAISIALPRPSAAQPESVFGGNAVDVPVPRGPEQTPDPIALTDDLDHSTGNQASPSDGLSRVPKATPVPTPVLDGALDVADGTRFLSTIPGVSDVIAAVERGDAASLLALMQISTRTCDDLGRERGENCEGRNGADATGAFTTVTYSSKQFSLVRVQRFVEAALALSPELTIVTREPTAEPSEARYILVYGIAPLNPSSLDVERTNPQTGFVVGVDAGAEYPLLGIEPLGASHDPLEIVQLFGSKDQQLILPSSLDGFRWRFPNRH